MKRFGLKHLFQFIIHPSSSEEDAFEELIVHQVQEIFFTEDLSTHERYLTGTAEVQNLPHHWRHISSIRRVENMHIDWQEQWQLFSPYFKQGLATIPLSDFGCSSSEEVHLFPGPGFGDLSHPTTHLVLSLLPAFVQDKIVVDMGCGSGILGLAALKMGAKRVIGVDIEPEALEHASYNARMNQLEHKIIFSDKLDPALLSEENVLLMNMTFQEQQRAISSCHSCLSQFSYWLDSGILQEQSEPFLQWASSVGFESLSTFTKDIWKGYILSNIQIKNNKTN
jgi:ribosomal protein L11 methyltransferase